MKKSWQQLSDTGMENFPFFLSLLFFSEVYELRYGMSFVSQCKNKWTVLN